MIPSNRRTFLKAAAAAALGLAPAGKAEGAGHGLKFGPPQPFSFDLLKETARRMAKEPYAGPARPAPEIVAKIDYEAWGKIKFDVDQALYATGPGRFPVSFFHLGMYFPKAVQMHVLEAGQAREIIYDPSAFDMPADSPARQLPHGSGFAGLRVQEARDAPLDWHDQRLGRIPRRGLFPRHRRIASIRNLLPRRRAQCRGRRPERGISRFHQVLHR